MNCSGKQFITPSAQLVTSAHLRCLAALHFLLTFAAKTKHMATHNKTFVLHDETINTYGFRMLTAGANLEEFRKNPVMLLNHNDYTLPIGRWENIRIEGTQILAEAHFDMADEKAREVAR